MKLFSEIEKVRAEMEANGHGWTTAEQAYCMAATIVALRPRLSIEIGVYGAMGLVCIAMAHKEVGYGSVIGIDPYLADASSEGQVKPEDQKFWAGLNHEIVYGWAHSNIQKYGVGGFSTLIRKKSSEYTPPEGIGLLRIDGNHGEQVLQDVRQYAGYVQTGGVLFLDDLDWTGGAVVRAAANLRMSGWRELYRIKNTAVFQKAT